VGSPAGSADAPFPGLMDVTLPVTVRLGSGVISVGDCLSLRPQSIVRLAQSVGQDLDVVVNGETVARGEVAIVDDSTSIRLTDIAVQQTEEVDV
jgi:flagellar motor switch protein FliN/FliY